MTRNVNYLLVGIQIHNITQIIKKDIVIILVEILNGEKLIMAR